MPTGLTDPLTAEDLASMSIDDLVEHHRRLIIRLRDVDHWQRLIAARLDLAVAAVADLPEPLPQRCASALATAALTAAAWPRELMASAVGAPPVAGPIPGQRVGTLAERLGAELDDSAVATPPDGLRDLLGIARFEERLVETALLPRLRRARWELDAYGEALRAVADQAAGLIALRAGAARLPA